jgi:hypothetical protein
METLLISFKSGKGWIPLLFIWALGMIGVTGWGGYMDRNVPDTRYYIPDGPITNEVSRRDFFDYPCEGKITGKYWKEQKVIIWQCEQ